jgi:hypothetical protein
VKISGNIKTTIVASEDMAHVYEITKDLCCEGEEVILLTLYPTITEPNKCDLSTMHMINHCADEGLHWSKIHFVYLFSKVAGSKLSTRGLSIDEENMDYLKSLISEKSDAKLIIAFGSSMEKCPAAIESKVKFFQMLKELRQNDALWQLDSEEMEEESPHILFAGIRYGDSSWRTRHYVVPYKYTQEGYAAYLAGKEARRELFIQNVLGVKMKNNEPEATEEKPKAKGKKSK